MASAHPSSREEEIRGQKDRATRNSVTRLCEGPLEKENKHTKRSLMQRRPKKKTGNKVRKQSNLQQWQKAVNSLSNLKPLHTTRHSFFPTDPKCSLRQFSTLDGGTPLQNFLI